MAGFSDAFSAENIGALMNDPRMLMGLQMLQQGGPQSGNPSLGARLGQAGIGAMQQIAQQQHSQQLNAYRQQMAALQAQQQQMAQAKAQQQAEQAQRQQAAFQDPAVLEQMGPLARMLAQQGLDPTTVLKANAGDNLQAHRQATLAQQAAQFDQRQANHGGGQPSGPRAPANRLTIDQPLGDDLYQRHRFNPATGGYEPWGEPFNKHSARAPKATSPADDATAAILNAEPPAAGADLGNLPGTGGLQSYAPQPQQPVGVLPMSAAGSLPGANKPAQQPGTRVPGQPKIATPQTKADYDALPSGAQYIDPASGRVATKR